MVNPKLSVFNSMIHLSVRLSDTTPNRKPSHAQQTFLAPTADMKDITLILDATGPAAVKGDAILLESALRNVLDNSVKYSPAETEIKVTLDKLDEAHWRLIIRDQGRGFSSDSLPELTARFKRGANVDQIVGSGLGLTIAEEVLDAHGGRLELRNPQTGAGACVSLILPAD